MLESNVTIFPALNLWPVVQSFGCGSKFVFVSVSSCTRSFSRWPTSKKGTSIIMRIQWLCAGAAQEISPKTATTKPDKPKAKRQSTKTKKASDTSGSKKGSKTLTARSGRQLARFQSDSEQGQEWKTELKLVCLRHFSGTNKRLVYGHKELALLFSIVITGPKCTNRWHLYWLR